MENFNPGNFNSYEKLVAAAPEEAEDYKPVEGGFVHSSSIDNAEVAHKEANIELLKDQAFEKLKKIGQALEEMNYTVEKYSMRREALDEQGGLPICADGDVRFSWSKIRGLTIWFTNGMENPENPERQAIKVKLEELGLGN